MFRFEFPVIPFACFWDFVAFSCVLPELYLRLAYFTCALHAIDLRYLRVGQLGGNLLNSPAEIWRLSLNSGGWVALGDRVCFRDLLRFTCVTCVSHAFGHRYLRRG